MKNHSSRIIVASRLFIGLMLTALLCFGSSAFAQNSTIFGPNVYVFTPSTPVATINSTLTTLAGNTQFSTNRYQVFFEPGTYTGVESEVGYYEAIAGLGETPTAVNISQGFLTVNTTDDAEGGCVSPEPAGCMTDNFWRSLENMEITVPAADLSTLQWGVSQGAAFRRMDINGGVELADTTCGETSGGFIADSEITGLLNACSQQQWYTRNSSLGSFTGYVWNDVFSGVVGAPPQSNPFSNDGENVQNTVLATTPVVREKPYLYMDGGGNYWVFSPSLLTNSSGQDWSNGGLGAGTSLAISTFLIATPTTTLSTINTWLATSGHNLILTPGIYTYSGAISVTNANTVVLGLGYADLVPQTGTAAISVADVNGVQLAGFLIDAGPVNSPVLLQIGVAGATRVSHATNPTSISDVYFRIGGATLGTCTEAEEVDSDNVIIDNTWIWRADHGNTGTFGWTANTCTNGLVVNGDNVTALGLAVEHFQGEQVEWNGQGGETIFYQSEMPYDVPSQAAWMNGTVDGYASYNVSPSVTSHTAYGLGVYSYFSQGVNIIANSGIAAPAVAGVTFTDSVSVWLAGSGQINYNIASNTPGVTNNAGTLVEGPLDTGSGPSTNVSDVSSWVGSSGGTTTTATPTFSPAAGTYSSAQTVTITDSTSGAKIYYTTNGTTPTTSSTLYSGAITVSATETIEAIAVATGDTNSPVASAAYTINATTVTATPTISPAAGTYTSAQTVTITDSTSGAKIYYTTNGTTPTTSSTLYSGAITISATETIEAIAVATGDTNSSVASAAYTINATTVTATPTISPAAGTYTSAQTVTISDSTSGAKIYYTTNGTTPTTSSTLYSGAITVSSTETIEAIAVATGDTNSSVASAAYTINATSSFTQGVTDNGSSLTVWFTPTPSSSSVILSYILNGSVQQNVSMTASNGTYTYSIPVTAGAAETLNPYYFTYQLPNGSQTTTTNYNWTRSTVSTAATPTFSPAAGTYTSAQTVTISDATSGAKIYYTTNGTTPTTSSTLYSGAITVSATETIEAIAVATGYTNSSVASAAYTINTATVTATPTFSPAAGTYTSAQTVTISDSTSGAKIYYTTNGTTPTTSSTLYSGAITVSASETIEAIAVASGDSNSAVASAAYTISTGSGTGSGGSTTYTYGVTDNSTSLVVTFKGTPTCTSAILSYTLNGTAQQNVTMTDSGGTFTYSIPVTAGAAESLSYYFSYVQSTGLQWGPTSTYTWKR